MVSELPDAWVAQTVTVVSDQWGVNVSDAVESVSEQPELRVTEILALVSGI